MKNWMKRGLAILLAAMMLVTVLPTALAAEEESPAEPFSLLPLDTRSVSVDLTGKLPVDLKAVKVSDLLATEIQNGNLTGTEKVAWAVGYGDAYTVVEMGDTINLWDTVDTYRTNTTLNMIVGSGKQLDGKNIRYTVNVTYSDYNQWLIPTLYKQDEKGVRTEIPVKNCDFYPSPEEDPCFLEMDVLSKYTEWDEELYLGLTMGKELGDAASRYDLKFYAGQWGDYENGTATDITSQIWNQDMTQKDAGYLSSYAYYDDYITMEFLDGTTVVDRMIIQANLRLQRTGPSGLWIYDDNDNGDNDIIDSLSSTTVTEDGVEYPAYTFTLYKEYPANGTYMHRVNFYDENGDYVSAYSDDFSKLLAVVGFYKTRSEAEAAIKAGQASDITDALFGKGSYNGYAADYSKGVMFSIFYNEDAYHLSVITETGTHPSSTLDEEDLPQRPGSDDTYFRVTGAAGYGIDNDVYVMPYEHDAYYANGYQTVFLLDSEADLSALKPTFSNLDVTHIYAGNPSVMQTSGKNVQDFSKGPVAYSAAAENGENKKNYTVTFAQKQTDGASLFVNGANGPKETDGSTRREVFLNNYYGHGHDIFLANLGDKAMTGLTVTLTDAKNVKLDEYWTVGGENNDTLAPFTTARRTHYDGELDNVAKIRLVSDGKGEISGKLSITYGVGQDTVVFTLTGNAGNPAITTTEIPAAVKYVPYGTMIQDSNMYDWNKVTYELVGGKLPEGVELRPNGEIYGVPQETGEFRIRVRMRNSVTSFPASAASFTLKVEENTDANVEAQTDKGYELTTRLPASISAGSDQTITSNGDLSEFIDLWLDGQKLEEGVDYEKSQGSTIINANSKVFRSAGNGNHTLAFEFRVNGDANQDLKKAAQNFKVGSSSSSSSSTSRPSSNRGQSSSTTKPETQKPTTPTISFKDVVPGTWFYDGVMWAAQNNLMIGVGAETFAPDQLISQPMVATIMARLADVDLSGDSNDVANTGVEPGQWYTTAAVWAWRAGIVGESTYAALPPLARGDLAVMLVRYLDYLGITYTAPDEAAAFTDNAEMTEEQLAAFQRLYDIGILKGVGDNYMAPYRSTTRAEMAIITQRLNTYLADK